MASDSIFSEQERKAVQMKSSSIITAGFLLMAYNCFAQRNLLDVPTGEIVEPKVLFFQQETVLNKGGIGTSTILT